jgi:hypothetical protein
MFVSRSCLATLVFLVGVAAALAGCSKDQPAPTGAPEGQKPPAEQPDKGKLSQAECQKMFEHVMDLSVNEAIKELGGPEGVDKETASKLRKEMRNDPELKKTALGCEKEFSREDYDCIMKARSSAAVDICEHK